MLAAATKPQTVATAVPLTVTEPDNKICNYDDRVGSKSIGDTRADNTGIQKIPNCIILRNFIKP